MRILVLNGPNLNLLGERDPAIYGPTTLEGLELQITLEGERLGAEVVCFQSNHEGTLIDLVHEHRHTCDGLIINPGALTHYSYALHDALEAVSLPTVEVHISDISKREEWRRRSVISDAAWKTIMGKGIEGYLIALRELVGHLEAK